VFFLIPSNKHLLEALPANLKNRLTFKAKTCKLKMSIYGEVLTSLANEFLEKK